MTSIKREWALNRLQAFLTTIQISYSPSPETVIGPGSYRLIHNVADVQTAAQVAEQILDRILPEWQTADWDEPKRPAQPWWRHREATRRAIAQLEAEQELLDNLGDGAPQLSASTLHLNRPGVSGDSIL